MKTRFALPQKKKELTSVCLENIYELQQNKWNSFSVSLTERDLKRQGLSCSLALGKVLHEQKNDREQ